MVRYALGSLLVVVAVALIASRLFRYDPYLPSLAMETEHRQSVSDRNGSSRTPGIERDQSLQTQPRQAGSLASLPKWQEANRSGAEASPKIPGDASIDPQAASEAPEKRSALKRQSRSPEDNGSLAVTPWSFGVLFPGGDLWRGEENESMPTQSETQILEDRLDAIGGEMGDPVAIRIFKREGVLELWMEVAGSYRLLKSYPICRYSGDLGPKLKEGDRQSPEGFYSVNLERLNPNSRYHLAMNIGYPNAYDRVHHRTGSYIMIHGGCVSVGCYAMGDAAIEEIYELVELALENGQMQVMVQIFPFRMEPERMEEFRDHRWYGFWENLQEGYAIFQKQHRLPVVQVKEGRYLFR